MSSAWDLKFSAPPHVSRRSGLLAALVLSAFQLPAELLPGAEPPAAGGRQISGKLRDYGRHVAELFESLGGVPKPPGAKPVLPPVSILPIAERSQAIFNEDPSRLPGIADGLARPLELPRRAVGLLDRVRPGGEAELIQAACEIAGLECAGAPPGKSASLEAIWAELEIQEPVPTEWKGLPSASREALRRILAALLAAVKTRREVFGGYGPAEIEAIRGPGRALSTPRSNLAPQSVVSFAAVHVQRGGLPRLAPVAKDLVSAALAGREGLRASPFAKVADKGPRRFESPHGALVFGTAGDDTYQGAALCILDPGGNDRYGPRAESTLESPSGVNLILDLGGDDEHGSKDADGCAGFGVAGISVVVDARGRDRYETRTWGEGAGLFGVGMLIDLDGNDLYEAESNAQGAAACGLGILYDAAGEDSYRVGAHGQGFGSVRGTGLLADARGNDTYRAGGLIPDSDRDASRFISMSQGFGFGYRFLDGQLRLSGFVSGGIGALVDAAGDDAYSCDVFGCGGAYFLSLGLLVDGGGSDRYRCTRYGLGGAVHQSAALLLDLGGDDRYESESTVTAGCGHDFACGLHLDLGGSDRYRLRTMSLGSANAAGAFGLFYNFGGNDEYRGDDSCFGKVVRGEYQPGMTPASRALFIDVGGNDVYEGREGPANGRRWSDPDFPDLAAGADR